MAIFSRHVVNQIGKVVVDLAHKRIELLVLLFFLSSEHFDPLDGLLDVLVATEPGLVFLQAGNFVSHLPLVFLQSLVLVVHGLDSALKGVVFVLEAGHLSTLVLQSYSHFVSDDFLDAVDVIASGIQLLLVIISRL